MINLERSRAREEQTASLVSTEHKTAVCVDAFANAMAEGSAIQGFEMILKELPLETRTMWAQLFDDYVPPDDLFFLVDKKELDVEFKRVRAHNASRPRFFFSARAAGRAQQSCSRLVRDGPLCRR